MSVVKPKPELLLSPIATDVKNTTSQSEFEANKCNWRQVRENACGENMIGLVWIPIGWESVASFDNQSQSVVMQNQSKREITLDTQMKTALKYITMYRYGILFVKLKLNYLWTCVVNLIFFLNFNSPC